MLRLVMIGTESIPERAINRPGRNRNQMNDTQTTTAPATAPRRGRIVTKSEPDEANLSLVLGFSNGEERTFEANALSDDIKRFLILHGLQQKLCDRFAGAAGDANLAVRSVDEGWDLLKSGETGRRGTSDGPSTSLVVRAIAELRSKTVEAVLVTWKTLAEDVRRNIAKDENVRRRMAEIKLREATAAAQAKATPAADLSAF